MKELDFSQIGQRIKEVRVERQLTQETLAEMTDVNISHISNIETNKVKVSLTLLVNICNALDTTVDELLCNNLKLVFRHFNVILVTELDKMGDILKDAITPLIKNLSKIKEVYIFVSESEYTDKQSKLLRIDNE